jgi:hypothetical protein
VGDNRPSRYIEDGKIIYRASSLGMCDKVFAALAMGYTPQAHPVWFQEILDEGTAQESTIREMWEGVEDDVVTDVGLMLELEVLDNVFIRGSVDGVTRDGTMLFEAKKIRDSGWARYLRSGVEYQSNYPMQTSFYMHALSELKGVDVGMMFVGGHYVQQPDGDWLITETHCHTYTTPPVNLLGIKKRIARLERVINEATVVGDVPCTRNMYPCPFFYLHDDDDADEPPVRPVDDVITTQVAEYNALEARRLALAPELSKIINRQKEIKTGVEGWLQAAGQESGDSGLVIIDNIAWELRYLTSPRAGYTVEPSEQTRVTIKKSSIQPDPPNTGHITPTTKDPLPTKPKKLPPKKLATQQPPAEQKGMF